MSSRQRPLSQDEIAAAFEGKTGEQFPVVLSPMQLARLLGRSIKTVYWWIAPGRFDSALRKRGKHVFIWRNRVIDILFNGKEWKSEDEQ